MHPTLQSALKLHRQGDLAAAAALYAGLLANQPDCADALHLLGVLKGQLGETAAGIDLIERAISKAPRSSPYHNNLGNLLKAAGDSARALESYRRAIRCNAGNAEAHHNLGRLLYDLGERKLARKSLHKALGLNPNLPEAHLSLACLEEAEGAWPQALTAAHGAIRLAPMHPQAHLMLGRILSATRDFEHAVAAFERALELDPHYADASFNLGITLYGQANYLDATQAFCKAIELAPQNASDAWNNLGLSLSELGQRPQAIAAFERALALKPAYGGACLNLGRELVKQGQPERARLFFEQAILIEPARKDAYMHLGTLEEDAGSLDRAAVLYRRGLEAVGASDQLEGRLALALAHSGKQEGLDMLERRVANAPSSAEASFHLGAALLLWVQQQWEPEADRARYWLRRALELDPGHSDALLNLGVLEERDGELDAAADLYLHACDRPNPSFDLLNNFGGVLTMQGHPEGIDLLESNVLDNPTSAEAHFSLSTALLLHGRYREGWGEYEWRRKVERLKANCRVATLPDWTGEPLEGRAILLYSEQGFGDSLQFARYVPLVAARGGRVVLDVQPTLRRLLKDLPGVAVMLDETLPLPDCTVCLPLMSLPRVFDTTLESIPEGVILNPAALEASDGFERRARLRVGLVWGGNPRHQRDRLRSIPLANFRPLADLDGVEFVSLQTGPASSQAETFPSVADCAWVKDFADTAQIIAGLDLVVTIDSAVAHLTGAMGKPVWILLANTPDWRWSLGSATTPWYRSARLFRQTTPRDWREVMIQVSAQLKVELDRRGKSDEPVQSADRAA